MPGIPAILHVAQLGPARVALGVSPTGHVTNLETRGADARGSRARAVCSGRSSILLACGAGFRCEPSVSPPGALQSGCPGPRVVAPPETNGTCDSNPAEPRLGLEPTCWDSNPAGTRIKTQTYSFLN